MLIRVLRVLLPLVVVGIAVLAAAAMIRSRPDVETQTPIIAPPGVRVHEVALHEEQVAVVSQGTVRPRTETQLVPEISGRVTWVAPSFAEGGFFNAGDTLLTLDPFDYQQAVVSARSQLTEARLRLATEDAEAEVAQREWEELGRGDPRALTLREPQLEDARASVAAAEANVERAQRDVERADIIAPYSGRVRTKSVDLGQFVTLGSPIATIYSVEAAEIRLPLPDGELAYLNLPLAYRGAQNRRGPAVTIRSTFAGSSYEWQGRIVRTEGEIDPVSRMVHVVAEVADPYAAGADRSRPPLAVGMYVDAEIEGRVFDDVAVLPRAALRGQNQVLIVDSANQIHYREIDILRRTITSIYVRGGLEKGDRVVTSAIDAPTEGMLVQVTDTTRREPPEPITRPAPRRRRGNAPTGEGVRLVSPPEAPRAALSPPAAPSRPSPPPLPGGEALALTDRLGQILVIPVPAALPPTAPDATPPSAPATEGATDGARLDEQAFAEGRGPDPFSFSLVRVAVRDFANVSRAAADDAFAKTVSDAITTRLGAVSTITVVASETNATWVVMGGVQRVGDMVRITANVVDVAQGSVIRALKFDGSASDQARLQQEVAAGLTQTLSTRFAR